MPRIKTPTLQLQNWGDGGMWLQQHVQEWNSRMKSLLEKHTQGTPNKSSNKECQTWQESDSNAKQFAPQFFDTVSNPSLTTQCEEITCNII